MSQQKAFTELTLLDKKSHPAVQAHITMLQGIISRMAQNSTNCKSWAIPIVSAIILLSLEKNAIPTLSAFIPLALFYLLDCYYLGLERRFRDQQRNFIMRLNKDEDITPDIFFAQDTDKKSWLARRAKAVLDQLLCTLDGMVSLSTTVVYGALALAVYLIDKI